MPLLLLLSPTLSRLRLHCASRRLAAPCARPTPHAVGLVVEQDVAPQQDAAHGDGAPGPVEGDGAMAGGAQGPGAAGAGGAANGNEGDAGVGAAQPADVAGAAAEVDAGAQAGPANAAHS